MNCVCVSFNKLLSVLCYVFCVIISLRYKLYAQVSMDNISAWLLTYLECTKQRVQKMYLQVISV